MELLELLAISQATPPAKEYTPEQEAAQAHAQKTRSQLEGTTSAAHGILRVRYSHDAMIDLMLANPAIKQHEIAAHFKVTGAWISRVVNSDAFLARLSQRKAELIDPIIVSNMQDKLMGLMDQSIEVLADKLEASKSPDLAAKALELSSKALGYGARRDNIAVQNTFVVALPAKEADSGSWAAKYGPGVQEATVVSIGRATPLPDKNPGSDLTRLAAAAGV